MATNEKIDIRAEVVRLLLEIVAKDRYPSATMLRMIEELADERERAAYARVLMDKVRETTYPSIPVLRRLVALR